MLVLRQLSERNCLLTVTKVPKAIAFLSTLEEREARGEFRVLELIPKKPPPPPPKRLRQAVLPPRETQMKLDQDWPSVWPGPRTFHPHSVPLPIRQGYNEKGPAPDKYANTELMKIPNFLHLTPPAIRRQCEAIKKFCTPWPKGLEDEKKCDKHFPMEIITSDYCYSSPTIRDPLARIVSLRVKLSSLELDYHARDKILRLLAHRYDPKTDYITIVVDRCPMRKQNLEYAEFLLTAVYNEARKIQPWESEKSEEDMEYYDWDKSKSKQSLLNLHYWPEPPKNDDYSEVAHSDDYKTAVSDMINNGEDDDSVNKYKESVKQLLSLRN